ncbi:MAG: response regulator [Synergistaceae bacterium]|jgi:putative two-component system response regulator|nr:response regulator [Synergistaceae bacterium]
MKTDRQSQIHSILVVDEDATNLRMLQEILKPLYKVYAAPSGKRAVSFLENRVPDMVLLDAEMPVIKGFDLIKHIKDDERTAAVPVLLLTARDDMDNDEQALSRGAADYITKPVTTGAVRARVGLHMRLTDQRKKLENMILETGRLASDRNSVLGVLSCVTAYRDRGMSGHPERTASRTRIIAEKLAEKADPDYSMSPKQWENIIKSARLHDIGHAVVPDSILFKPGKLTFDELEKVKEHTTAGARMIDDAMTASDSDSSFLQAAREVALFHHERWDGLGYPRGLSGAEIPLSARVVAVADVYDSMTSDRLYKRAVSHEEAVETIRGETGHFDPRLIELLRDVFPLFQNTERS